VVKHDRASCFGAPVQQPQRVYGLEKQHAEVVNHDRFAAIKANYLANGGGRGNLRYGYVARAA